MNNGNLILFAQQKGPPDEAAALAFLGAWLFVIIGVGVFLFLIWLVVAIFYCLTLSRAMQKVSESRRLMAPGLVWLFLVPCLNIVWQFLLAIWVPGSLEKEFKARDMHNKSDYGKMMGILAGVFYAVNLVTSCIPFVNYCSWIFGVAGLVFWIIFWVQIAGYSAQLDRGGKSRKSSDDDDDED